MKATLLILVAMISTVQTVGWVECCCVLICKHHNDPCKDECKDKEAAPVEADCCAKKAAPVSHHEDEKRCSHVEPSSEVVAQTATLPPVIMDVVLELPVVLLLPAPAESEQIDGASGHSSVRGSPPLHLLYSVFLI